MHDRVAVVLGNLGGPSSLGDVKQFLFNIFYDKYIINLPRLPRYLLALMISSLRHKKANGIYSKMGGKSPILEQTLMQAQCLRDILSKDGGEIEVFVHMRHSKPDVNDLMQSLIDYQPSRIVYIPLYPQFSTTTTLSALKDLERIGLTDFEFEGCYFNHPSFIAAHVDIISQCLKNHSTNSVILFSAHSLPKKIIAKGDPYQFQMEKCVSDIMSYFPGVRYDLAYQSKVGFMPWLEPKTEDKIASLAGLYREIVVVPIAFVSEHSETLVELDMDYKELAKNKGYVKYTRAPALGVNKYFIECLADIVKSKLSSSSWPTNGEAEVRLECGKRFKFCGCK